MSKTEAHRAFDLVSPREKGEDVAALQKRINERYKHYQIDRRINADGEFGRQTMKAAKQVGIIEGAVGDNLKKLKHNRVSISCQKLIRGGRDRTLRERIAYRARKRYRKKLRKRYAPSPGKIIVAWMKQQVGVTESPAGSNWGPKIGEWIKFTGYSGPVYWCGCFACYAVVKIGGAKVPNRIRLGYTGYIVSDANAGVNGLTAVPFANARAGDIVVYTFDHIGVVTARDGDTLLTIEGNTSSGRAGSQSNGGGVFARTRSRSDVVVIARPHF